MTKPKAIEFDAPKDFRLPEGKQSGDEFSLVCDFKMKPNGKLCLVKLGDQELDYAEDAGEKRGDYKELTAKMQSDYQPPTQ